ncbi:MAG TPA: helix-turn-helix domain-containing protein [Solirubrobacteraceae bacterium]
MPEIGSSLREARMRDRIDITEAEADTKIRGKYLRALENEEWDLLPGPTFVKSFLRTYADYLGLDGRMLVEEFKLRYERPELQPIVPPRGGTSRDRDRRSGGRDRGRRGGSAGGQGPGRARLFLIGGLVVALLVGLFLLGVSGGSDNNGSGTTASSTPTRTTTTTTKKASTPPARAAPTAVRLKIIPTGTVYTCLRAGSAILIKGVNLQAGTPTKTYTARKMRLLLGNGSAKLVVNGKTSDVPASSNAIAYVITPTRTRRVPPAQGPGC